MSDMSDFVTFKATVFPHMAFSFFLGKSVDGGGNLVDVHRVGISGGHVSWGISGDESFLWLVCVVASSWSSAAFKDFLYSAMLGIMFGCSVEPFVYVCR